MFADSAKVFIKSGKGGDGHVSFRRGTVCSRRRSRTGGTAEEAEILFLRWMTVSIHLTDFRHVRKYVAEDGEQGGKKRCHGANGKDLVIKVPEGTVLKTLNQGR